MRTKLIMLDTPIIVSDEEINEDAFVTNGVEVFSRNSMPEYSDEYANRYWQKIIAGIEGLPRIDWNGLEKEFGWVDVEKMAMDYLKSKWAHLYQFDYPQKPFPTNYENDLNLVKVGIYETQSLNDKKFSLEDMRMAWLDGWQQDQNERQELKHTGSIEFIQLLQQPKVFDIEIETKNRCDKVTCDNMDCNNGCKEIETIPRITNNSIKIIKKL